MAQVPANAEKEIEKLFKEIQAEEKKAKKDKMAMPKLLKSVKQLQTDGANLKKETSSESD